LVGRIKAQDVHVESRALLDESEADAARAYDGDGFSGHLIPEKRQVGMPVVPFVFSRQVFGRPHLSGEIAHQEEGKFRRCFGEHVGSMREGDFVAIGVAAVNVVETDGDLGYHLERAGPSGEYFGVDRIAQRGDQAVDAGLYFFDDQSLGRRFGLRINLKLVTLLAKDVKCVTDFASSKDAVSWAHVRLASPREQV